jgi:hypothetical protein
VTEQRLYHSIRQPKSIEDRSFEIEFIDAGVEAYAFTSAEATARLRLWENHSTELEGVRRGHTQVPNRGPSSGYGDRCGPSTAQSPVQPGRWPAITGTVADDHARGIGGR